MEQNNIAQNSASTGQLEHIALSPTEAGEIARLLRKLMPEDNSLATLMRTVDRVKHADQPAVSHDTRSLMSIARQVYVRRRARARYFSDAFFDEPGWDMLLGLYASEDSGVRQTVKGVVDFASCAPSTALRYVNELVREGLIERRPNPVDLRSNFICLSDKGRLAMEQYLSMLIETGQIYE